LYPFGYGLSYTTFALADLELSSRKLSTDGKIRISCAVTNTGAVAGEEVVQLYQAFHGAHVVRPNKQLAGFRRVALEAGETKHLTFTLDAAQLGYYNEDMEFVVEPGKLDIMLGTSSEELPLQAQVSLVGEKKNLLQKRVYTCPVEVR
jgi:beta-glucosidase